MAVTCFPQHVGPMSIMFFIVLHSVACPSGLFRILYLDNFSIIHYVYIFQKIPGFCFFARFL